MWKPLIAYLIEGHMKKLIREEPSGVVDIIAQLLHDRTCIIKGCEARWHKDDALAIMDELKKRKLLNGDVT